MKDIYLQKKGKKLLMNIKKSQKFQKIHIKIIQKRLQMRMKKKYLKKDIYLQKKDRKLLIILDQL